MAMLSNAWAHAQVHEALEEWLLVAEQGIVPQCHKDDTPTSDAETIPGVPLSDRALHPSTMGISETVPATLPDFQHHDELREEIGAMMGVAHRLPQTIPSWASLSGDVDVRPWQPQWALDWAKELDADAAKVEERRVVDQLFPQKQNHQTVRHDCPSSPMRASKRPRAVYENPWETKSQDDMKMIRDNDGLVAALHVWDTQMKSVPRSPKMDVVMVFQPEPPLRTEAQLHLRVAAMGVDVFPKGASPPSCPFGLQGGQRGQFAVSLVLSRDPVTKVTLQLQCAKGNVVLKGKQSAFDIGMALMVLPYLGAPVQISGKAIDAPSVKQTGKDNIPLVKAASNTPGGPQMSAMDFFCRSKPC